MPRVRFVKLPSNVYGEYDPSINEIKIDVMKPTDPARTFLHEKLHFFYPDLSETAIRSLESITWKKMSMKARLKLYRELFRR